MTSREHFFSKWGNSSGHIMRVNSHGRFLVVITNGANTVGQPTQGVGGETPDRTQT